MFLTDVLLQDWLIGWRKRDQTYSLNIFIFFLYSLIILKPTCYLVAHVWSTRAWWARVLYKVPEPTQLEYQAGETGLMGLTLSSNPAWYPSLVGSGTSQSTRAHQARVRTWVGREPKPHQNLFHQLGTRAWWARVLCKVPEPTKLEYFTRGPLSTVWTVWPTKFNIFFFSPQDSGLQGSLFKFFFFLFIQCGPRVVFCFFVFFFFFHSGPAMWKTFFINSLFFNFYFFYLYNM